MSGALDDLAVVFEYRYRRLGPGQFANGVYMLAREQVDGLIVDALVVQVPTRLFAVVRNSELIEFDRHGVAPDVW